MGYQSFYRLSLELQIFFVAALVIDTILSLI